MARKQSTRSWLRDNSLSLVLGLLFVVFLVGLAISGYLTSNEDLTTHGQPTISFVSYLGSGEFVEAVFENWESEFLQMGALVILTIFLHQKGAADSKNQSSHASSRHGIIRSHLKRKLNGKSLKHMLYANSLGIALFVLFIISFVLHAIGGASTFNQEATLHHEPTVSALQYVTTSQFWFESFQNWQSEFLAVVTLLLLSVYLRQRGSPESKKVSDPDSKTGD